MIRVPAEELEPETILPLLEKISKACNALVMNLTKAAVNAPSDNHLVAGVSHQTTQTILNCAIHADSAKMQIAVGMEQLRQAKMQEERRKMEQFMPSRPVPMNPRNRA